MLRSGITAWHKLRLVPPTQLLWIKPFIPSPGSTEEIFGLDLIFELGMFELNILLETLSSRVKCRVEKTYGQDSGQTLPVDINILHHNQQTANHSTNINKKINSLSVLHTKHCQRQTSQANASIDFIVFQNCTH